MENNKCSKCGDVIIKDSNMKNKNSICLICTKKKRNTIVSIILGIFIAVGLLACSFLNNDNTLTSFEGVNVKDSTAIHQKSIEVVDDSLANVFPKIASIGETVSNIDSFKREFELKNAIPSISILYNLNNYELSPTNSSFLLYIIEEYNKLEHGNKLLVEGYACDLGSDKMNDLISQKRSVNVKDFLVKNGVDQKNIEIKWYGKRKFSSTDDINSSRTAHRNTTIKILN